MLGTTGTAILAGRGGFKAAKLIDAEDRRVYMEQDGHGGLDTVDKVKIAWPLFLPAAGMGTVTIVSIIMAHRVSSSQLAAMATLYAATDDRFKEYREQVVEKFGPTKEQRVHDDAVQEHINKNPHNEVFVIGSGEVLCLDRFSGRYFRSSVDRIKKAENALNHSITLYDYADLSSFYLDIGLPRTGYSDNMGWNSANPLDVRYSTGMSADDSQPCIAIDFVSHPRTDFHQTF